MSKDRILVVDNEPQIRRVLRATLTGEGFEVCDVREGQEALEQMRLAKFDLVLLDINMPRLNGFETCRAIRKTSAVPIIMLSVREAEGDKVEALEAGADDYVTKPFGAPELIARIHATLRRSTPTLESRPLGLRFDGVEIDLEAREVRTTRGHAHLTPKEFDVLAYLAGHANKTVTQNELLHAIWGPECDDEDENLRVIIGRLRKKIEFSAANPKYLLTDYGVGYRLQLPG